MSLVCCHITENGLKFSIVVRVDSYSNNPVDVVVQRHRPNMELAQSNPLIYKGTLVLEHSHDFFDVQLSIK